MYRSVGLHDFTEPTKQLATNTMKISPFKLGLALAITGIIWISFVFDETDKAHDSIMLKQLNSFELSSEFTGTDLGFYRIFMPEFSGEEVFVQILDTNMNIIQEDMIQTKMSVGYFDYSKSGTYTIKVTNVSKSSAGLEIEFGNINSQEMILPGVLILVGTISIMALSYLKIKNYKIEQPDENIS